MRPGAFAAAVAGRHRTASGRMSRPALVLMASRRHIVVRPSRSARHEHIPRSLRLNVRVDHSAFIDRRLSIVRQERTPGGAGLERIVTRTVTRPTTLSPVIHPTPQAIRAATQVAPVTRVVREHSPQAEPAREPSEARHDIKPIRPGLVFSPPPASAVLPPVELERVTDHVLRSLDRRMSSWRDRRGRS